MGVFHEKYTRYYQLFHKRSPRSSFEVNVGNSGRHSGFGSDRDALKELISSVVGQQLESSGWQKVLAKANDGRRIRRKNRMTSMIVKSCYANNL